MKYEIRYFNGETMKYSIKIIEANNEEEAKEHLYSNNSFEHEILSIKEMK